MKPHRVSSSKKRPSAQGHIWEWRAFGVLDPSLVKQIRKYPIRGGILNRHDDDIYLVSKVSDQNIKIRKTASHWFLKFKVLLETGSEAIELYQEGSGMSHRFPVRRAELRYAASLLQSQYPDELTLRGPIKKKKFLAAIAHLEPAVAVVPVTKVRSQFAIDDEGWVELARAVFPKSRISSISIHSRNLEVVEEFLEELPGLKRYKVMNYVEACRKWGKR